MRKGKPMKSAAIDHAYKPAVRIALATAIILLIPFLAMQFTEEVVWGPADFAVAGFLLFGAGLTYELLARKTAGNIAYRAAIGVAVAASLIIVWVNLAVGLIGAEGNPVNLVYLGVLAVGIVGATIARFQPRGMARALLTMALVQALVGVIALFSRLGSSKSEALGVFFLNGFFVVLFAVSAWLFLRSSQKRPELGGS